MHPLRSEIGRRLIMAGGVALLLGVLTARPAAQSVADLARRSRDGEKKKAGRVYTNRDLENARGQMARSTLPAESASPADAGTHGQPAGESTRERFHRLFLEHFDWLEHARQSLDRATREHDNARFELENVRPVRQVIFTDQGYMTYWYLRADPATVRRLEQALARTGREVARAEADLAAAEEALADLEREARRQDVPPGVLRNARKDWAEKTAATSR